MEIALDKQIFSGFGSRILQRNGRFYIVYDAGEIAIQNRQVEVTEAEAQKAQRSERDAYEVLITK